MKKIKMKRLLLLLMGCVLIVMSFQVTQLVKAEDSEIVNNPNDDSFYVIDENGMPILIDQSKEDLEKIQLEEKNAKYKVVSSVDNSQQTVEEFSTYEAADQKYKKEKYASLFRSRNTLSKDVQLFFNDDIMTTSNDTYNIVKFKRTVVNGYVANINYTELNTGRSGYLNPSSVADAAYIRTEGDYYICKMGGVVIKVNKSYVAGTPTYKDADKSNNLSYYKVSGDKLIHYFSYYSGTSTKMGSTTVGYKPTYLNSTNEYYSYDGHYFYTSFESMVDDYRAGHYNHSVNASNPYYNYYQYLSLRTKTKMSNVQFDNRVKNVLDKPENSKMNGKGQVFINAQNTYGVNAGMIFGIASNESAYGSSSIAINKNNIFGLNAVDSSPGQSANYFKDVEQCVDEFAFEWMSKGYLDSYDGRYRGAHLGDKNSGINVKYASDPFWGEKAASQGYFIDTSKIDYGRYTIGIANKEIISLYKQPTKSSTELYNSEAVGSGKAAYMYDYPVVILDTVKGEDGKTWYKIQSDVTLAADRSARKYGIKYDYTRDYAYVLASEINVVFKGNNDIGDTVIVRGDVNGNGKIDAADYLMVMDTILGKYNMQTNQKIAGDVNGNGKIDAADYLMIMDCILGKIKL